MNGWTVLGASAAVCLLGVTAPPSSSWRSLQETVPAADATVHLVAVVSLSAWALALWLGVTVLLTVTARAPGVVGRRAAVLVGRVAPAAVRRAVEAALGLGLAASVLGASPAAAASTTPVAAPSVVAAAPAPSPVPGTADLDLDWGGGAPARASTPPTGTLAAEPAPPAEAPGAAVAPAGPTGDAVVVQPGDTLWGLAEHALRHPGKPAPSNAQIAQAWPQWWSANRDVIGEDPDLILPGTSLQPPPGGTAGAGHAPS